MQAMTKVTETPTTPNNFAMGIHAMSPPSVTEEEEDAMALTLGVYSNGLTSRKSLFTSLPAKIVQHVISAVLVLLNFSPKPTF